MVKVLDNNKLALILMIHEVAVKPSSHAVRHSVIHSIIKAMKEYLNQARHLDALINCRLREIDYWRDLSSSISGSNFEPHYNPNKPTEAPFVRCLEKIDAIQRDVAEKIAYLVRLKGEINTAIDALEMRDEQLVLRYRYLDDCTWEEISRMLNVSLRTVHRIHGSALQHFSVPE